MIKYNLRGYQYTWFLGYLSKLTLEKENALLHVTKESVGTLFSNRVLTDILDIINDKDEINPSEIYRLLPYEITQATGYRFISNLLTEKAITLSNKDGKFVYYKINEDYFKKGYASA